MERLASSKLRAELQWGAPPIASLKPSTKFRETPSAALMHRLEGIVWALEQQVTKQAYQIRGMRSHIAKLDEELSEARADVRRAGAQERVLADALGEAESWVGRLLVAAEKEAHAHRIVREELEAQLAQKPAKRKGSSKSNYEQQVEAVAAK